MATHCSILAWRTPMERGAWWATVHRGAKSQTWLKQLSSNSMLLRWQKMLWDCFHKKKREREREVKAGKCKEAQVKMPPKISHIYSLLHRGFHLMQVTSCQHHIHKIEFILESQSISCGHRLHSGFTFRVKLSRSYSYFSHWITRKRDYTLNGHEKSPCLSHLNSADSAVTTDQKDNTEAAPKTKEGGACPGGQMVKTLHLDCRGCGFDPWWGTKIPHATRCISNKKRRSQCHACACYNPQPTCYPLHSWTRRERRAGWARPMHPKEPVCRPRALQHRLLVLCANIQPSQKTQLPQALPSLCPSYTSQSDAREVKQTGGELGSSPSWLACVMERGSLKPVSLSKNMGTLTSILPGRHHGNVKTYFCDSDHQSGLFN